MNDLPRTKQIVGTPTRARPNSNAQVDRGSNPHVALVTGASRGIGRGIAQHLRDFGYLTAGVSLNNPAPACDWWATCDVGDPTQVDRVVSDIYGQFGRIDILVNCAGIGEFGPLTGTSFDIGNRSSRQI